MGRRQPPTSTWNVGSVQCGAPVWWKMMESWRFGGWSQVFFLVFAACTKYVQVWYDYTWLYTDINHTETTTYVYSFSLKEMQIHRDPMAITCPNRSAQNVQPPDLLEAFEDFDLAPWALWARVAEGYGDYWRSLSCDHQLNFVEPQIYSWFSLVDWSTAEKLWCELPTVL